MLSPGTRYFAYAVLLVVLALVLWVAASALRQSPKSTDGESTTIHVGTPLVGERPSGEPSPSVNTAEEPEDDGGGAEGAAEDGAGDGDAEAPADDGPVAPPVPAGEELYRSARCGVCHGDDLGGAEQGPPLKGLSQNYDAGQLKTFMKDPAAYAIDNQRLIDLGRQYELVMPRSRLPEEQLDVLVRWLLAQ
jgi:mono/diheme cytochrome c family protein